MNINSLPDFKSILNGNITVLVDKDPNICYALMGVMCHELEARGTAVRPSDNELNDIKFRGANPSEEFLVWLMQADNYVKFIMENYDTEMMLMGIRTALKLYAVPFVACQMPNLRKFFTDNQQHIIELMSK